METSSARIDAEIRSDALLKIVCDPVLLGEYVDRQVRDGWVTLEGDVDHQYQSDRVYERVAGVDGITGSTNALKVIEEHGVAP